MTLIDECRSNHQFLALDKLWAGLPNQDNHKMIEPDVNEITPDAMAIIHEKHHSDAVVFKGRRIPLIKPLLVGRAADNDLVINDNDVSRRHMMIYRQGNDWWLSDLGSRNGVHVNGIRLIHARRLRNGDEVGVGRQILSFISANAKDQSTVILPGETTVVTAESRYTQQAGAILCKLIVTSSGGEILEGEKAARWFFGKSLERPFGSTRSFLPPAVRGWLERQGNNVPPCGLVLELQEADRRVIVTLCRFKAERFFLLVREESHLAIVERLKDLGLSGREAEVMHWVKEGKTNPEIGTILNVTVHTVNRHMEHIFAKLGVENRQKAIVTVLERISAS